MKDEVSPATGRRYPFTMVCKLFRLARSSGYAAAGGRAADAASVKPGPRPKVSDEELLQLIRSEIESCPFVDLDLRAGRDVRKECGIKP